MTVRIGVIGAGALGFHHTRILRDVPGAQLVGFHDANAERAQKVSDELGVKAFPTLEGLLDAVQADTSVLDGLPVWLRFVVLAALPPALAFLAGYRQPSNRV